MKEHNKDSKGSQITMREGILTSWKSEGEWDKTVQGKDTEERDNTEKEIAGCLRFY